MADLGTIAILDTETSGFMISGLTYNLDLSLPSSYGIVPIIEPIAQNEFISITQYGIAGTSAPVTSIVARTGQLFPRVIG